jgi:hypothetical protein
MRAEVSQDSERFTGPVRSLPEVARLMRERGDVTAERDKLKVERSQICREVYGRDFPQADLPSVIAAVLADRVTAIRERCEYAETIDRLQAIVDRLPKTADGVTVTPGMRVYIAACGDVTAGFMRSMEFSTHSSCCHPVVVNAYSTREAAEASQPKISGKHRKDAPNQTSLLAK